MPLVVFRALSLLNVEEFGKGFTVLVTIGEGLCRNKVRRLVEILVDTGRLGRESADLVREKRMS